MFWKFTLALAMLIFKQLACKFSYILLPRAYTLEICINMFRNQLTIDDNGAFLLSANQF